MTTASPRDGTRLPQTRGRGEKAVLEEHIPRVHGELCGRTSHEIGRDRSGPHLQAEGIARAR